MIDYRRNTIDLREKAEIENDRIKVDQLSGTAEIAFVIMAEQGAIDDVTATEHMDSFATWQANERVALNALRTYGATESGDVKLYRCLQPHTTQTGWEPDKTPALWKLAGDPMEEWPPWSQPIGAMDAYPRGEKVTHNAKRWVSDVENNVWEPGVYGWTEGEVTE